MSLKRNPYALAAVLNAINMATSAINWWRLGKEIETQAAAIFRRVCDSNNLPTIVLKKINGILSSVLESIDELEPES